jgi:hypothetical protein
VKGGLELKAIEQIFISGKMPVGSDVAVSVQEAVMTYGMEAAKEISKKRGVNVRPMVKQVSTIGIENEVNKITRSVTQMYVILIIVDMVVDNEILN